MKRLNRTLAIAAIAAASMFSVQTVRADDVSSNDYEIEYCLKIMKAIPIQTCDEWQVHYYKNAFAVIVERIRDHHIKISRALANYLLKWAVLAGWSRNDVMACIYLDIED